MVPFKLHHWLLEINNLCLPSDIASFMFLGICPTQPFPTVLTGGEPGPVQGLHSQNTLPKGNQRGRIPPLSLGEEFWRVHPEKKGNSSPVCFTTRMHSVHFCRINWAVCMPGVASVAILPRAALREDGGSWAEEKEQQWYLATSKYPGVSALYFERQLICCWHATTGKQHGKHWANTGRWHAREERRRERSRIIE